MRAPTITILSILVAVSACATSSSSEPAATPSEWKTPSVEPDGCGDPFKGQKLRFSKEGWKTDFCKHSVDYSELRGGGPPRDGIPPIDKPAFVSIKSASAWLGDKEPVILLELGGEARVYPLQIMTWHEVVNDEVAGHPIAVTFCPLCYAAVVFKRPVVDGQLLSFGTSGNLRNSDLVMWDRQTESWWQQFEGRAIVGRLMGQLLVQLPATISAWQDVRETFPDAKVLSRETGVDRPYGRNPYVGYDDINQKPFLYEGKVGEALAPMAHVVGIKHGGQARAYAHRDLRSARVIEDSLGGDAIVVFYDLGVASALDTQSIADGRDIGSSSVFLSKHEGRILHFRPKGRNYVDNETGSVWNRFGKATKGPLQGTSLVALPRHDVFWFVWSAFAPEGALYDPR